MGSDGLVRLDLTKDELLSINNALNEVCNGPDALPEWEFQTRMGVSSEAAKATLSRITIALDRAL